MRNHNTRRRVVLSSGAALGLGGLAGCLGDDDDDEETDTDDEADSDFPTEPITLIVPFGEGGGTDSFARQIATQMSDYFGEPVQVSNVPGAASLQGTGQMATADPDGHTFSFFNPPSTPVSWLVFGADWDITDLRGVATHSQTDYLVLANNDVGLGVGEFDEMLDMYAEGELETIGGQEPGSHLNIMALALREELGMDWDRYVGYGGGADILDAVASGEVPVALSEDKSPLAAQDQVTVVGVVAQDGSAVWPDVPGGEELGLPDLDYVASGPMASYAPPGTPDDIIEELNDAIGYALEQDEVQEWAEENNFPINFGTPEDAEQAVAEAIEQIPEVVDLDEIREQAN